MATTSQEQAAEPHEERSKKELLTLRQTLPNRWLVCLILMGACATGMFVLPSPYPYLLLVMLVIAALIVAAHDAAIRPSDVRHSLHEFQANTARIRSLADQESGKVAFSRNGWLIVFTAAACVLMALAAIAFQPTTTEQPLTPAIFLTALGGIALGIALRFSPEAPLLRRLAVETLAPQHARLDLVVLGVLFLAVVAEISGHLLDVELLENVSLHVQFALWALGIALVTAGMAGASGLLRGLVNPLRSMVVWLKSHSFSTALPIIGIFALALVVRLWDVGNTVRMPIDEEHYMQTVIGLESDPALPMLEPATRLATLGVYSYGQWWAVELFGHNLAALRLLSVLIGSLTIPALYVLADNLFDRKTALIAALLLATFPPHVHFSRLALQHVADTLFGTLALAFLARGLKHNRRTDWALAGASLGLTQYFFEAGRLFFVPLVILWVVALAASLWRGLQNHWQGLMIAALTALFVAAPVYYALYALDLPITSRLDESGLGTGFWTELLKNGITGEAIGTLIQTFTLPFQAYVHQPEMRLFFFYYGGEQPLVLLYFVPLFLLGISYTIWNARKPAVLVFLWIVGVALGNGLLHDPFSTPRWVVAFPAIALLIALGIRHVLPLFWASGSQLPVTVALTALAIAIAVGQITYYFNVHLPYYNRQLYTMREESDGYDAVLRTEALPYSQTIQIVLIGTPTPDRGLFQDFERYIRGDMLPDMYMRSADSAEITPEYLAALPSDRRYAFFIDPEDSTSLNTIERFFWTEPPVGSPYGSSIPDDREYQLVYAEGRR